jgi:hypothetical protein
MDGELLPPTKYILLVDGLDLKTKFAISLSCSNSVSFLCQPSANWTLI